MYYFPLLIAIRYIRGAHYEKTVSTMIWICCLGIFIGSCALTLTTIIMNGFEQATQKKLRSIHAPIIMQDDSGNGLNFDAIAPILQQEFPEILAFSPSSHERVIIQNPDCDDITNVILLKAIDPTYESRMSSLSEKIISLETGTNKQTSLAELIHDNHIVIGSSLARRLCITEPEKINILTARTNSARSKNISLGTHTAIVSGILNTGIDDFDNNFALCSQSFAHIINPETEVCRIDIELNQKSDEQKVIQKLKQRFNLDVFSWQDLYPALISALKLQKYAMFLVLALITLVASMNILSLLFMYTTQKRADIAIFLALGMKRNDIQTAFMIIGMAVSLFSCLSGLALGVTIGLVLQYYPFIKLPDAYYVTYLPAQVNFGICFAVLLLVIIVGFIASWLPTRSLRHLHIAETLRSER